MYCGIIIQYQGMLGLFHYVFVDSKKLLERRYTTWISGVSVRKPLKSVFITTELGSLVRPIVSAAVHGRPVGAQTFMGRSTSKCLNLFYFPTHRSIQFSINWCMERGHMYLHSLDIIVAFCNFGSFFCIKIVMQSEKNPLEGDGPLLRGNPPLADLPSLTPPAWQSRLRALSHAHTPNKLFLTPQAQSGRRKKMCA